MSRPVDEISHTLPLAPTRYGHFDTGRTEYVIVDPRTPRPWINVIANPRVGLAVSQTGSGFSWIDNSQLAALVRWQQDLCEDRSGRFLFLRDEDDGAAWSLSPAPCWPAWSRFACRHGLGYTTFELEHRDTAGAWTLFVDAVSEVEIWRVSLRNLSGSRRSLVLVPFLEWNCGTSPAPRREFRKLFMGDGIRRRRTRRGRDQPHVGRPVGAMGPLEHAFPVLDGVRVGPARERGARGQQSRRGCGRARGVLPAERRVRIPRSAAGLAGVADDRSVTLPGADPAARGAPVRRRFRRALVAPAHRAGPRHTHDRRPALARVRDREPRQGDR